MPPSFMKKKKSGVYEPLLHAEDPDKACTYINLTIVDASDAVYSMVNEKIQSKGPKLGNGPASKIKAKVANSLSKAAAANVPPKTIAEALSNKLPKMLMYKMGQKGMKLAAQTVFMEDSFVVIQLQIQHVDSIKLMNDMTTEASGGDDGDDDDSVATAVLDEWIEEQQQLHKEEKESPFVTSAATATTTSSSQENVASTSSPSPNDWKEALVNFLEWLISRVLPVTIQRSLEQDQLPALIQSKLSEMMQSMMQQKLAGKSLQADVAVLAQQDEARYFFSHLQKVRGGKKEDDNAAGASG